MIGVSTHILDTALGRPAAGVPVRLEPGGGGAPLAVAVTDADGRVKNWLPQGLPPGRYRLIFGTGEWLRATGRDSVYLEIAIEVELKEGEKHYHLPLLLAPNGYTTYRGS